MLRIKDRTGRPPGEENDVRKTRNMYFQDFQNMEIEELVAVSMCGFDDARRSNYMGELPVSRSGSHKDQ